MDWTDRSVPLIKSRPPAPQNSDCLPRDTNFTERATDEESDLYDNGVPCGHAIGDSTIESAAAGQQETKHRRHHGGRHRNLEYRRLPSRHDGREDAEPRPIGPPGHDLYRLLCRGKLHG